MKRFLLSFFVYACVTLSAFDPTIPVLHLPDYHNPDKKAEFMETLEYAASEVGFFALTGTGVDPVILDSAYDQMAEFFKLDFETKMEMESLDGQRGYIPGESAKGEDRVDVKEFLHIGREVCPHARLKLKYGANVWPSVMPTLKPAMVTLYNALDRCGQELGVCFSELLGQAPEFVNQMTKKGDCLMRAIHYPANPGEEATWAGAHTDINLFTILPRSTAKGLQVLNKEGVWVDVMVPDGAFVINVADMLGNMSNGFCRSSMHRVTDPGLGEERYSLVFFVHPRPDDRMDPLPNMIEKTGGVRRYANLTQLEMLAERLVDLGLASDELMEFFVNSGAIEKLQEVGRFSPNAEKVLIERGYIN